MFDASNISARSYVCHSRLYWLQCSSKITSTPSKQWNGSVIRYNLRMFTRIYFQPKIGRKIKIFSLARRNNIRIKMFAFKIMSRIYYGISYKGEVLISYYVIYQASTRVILQHKLHVNIPVLCCLHCLIQCTSTMFTNYVNFIVAVLSGSPSGTHNVLVPVLRNLHLFRLRMVCLKLSKMISKLCKYLLYFPG